MRRRGIRPRGYLGCGADATSFHVGTDDNQLDQTGTINLSATAGTSRLLINGSTKRECTVTGAAAAVATGLYPWTGATTGTQVISQVIPTFGNCTGPLGLGFTVVCGSPGGGVTTNLAVTGVPTPFAGTAGVEIANIKCVETFTASGCTANIAGSYQNPATPATVGKLTVFTAGQSLTVSGSGCPAVLPNGAAQFGAPLGTVRAFGTSTTR